MALHFTEGQQVEAGALLAEIDPRPWQVALTSTGPAGQDQATLANARRDLPLRKLAKPHWCRSRSWIRSARWSAKLGTIKTDEGNVASAQLNLTYSRITAPIAGRVGLKQVDVGNTLPPAIPMVWW